MDFTLTFAQEKDLDLLVELRMEVLRAANRLPDAAVLPQVEQNARRYYASAIPTGKHLTLLAYAADGALAGCGGVDFYTLLPTVDNPGGECAYIMNMYTRPAYRRQGVARILLRRLIDEAKARGVGKLTLEATAMGRPLYDRMGFLPMEKEMELPLQ